MERITKETRLDTKKKLLIIGIVAAVVLISVVVTAVYMTKEVNSYTGIYPGVTALSADLTGMSRPEAKEKLLEISNSTFEDKKFTIVFGNKRVSLTAEEAGIAYDVDSMADDAYYYGRDRWLFSRYLAVKNKKAVVEMEPKILFSTDRVAAVVDDFISRVDCEKVEPSFEVKNDLILVDMGADGHSVDRDSLVKELTSRVETQLFGEYTADVAVDEPQDVDLDAIYQEVYCEKVPTQIEYVPETWTEETADQWTPDKLASYKGNHKYLLKNGVTGVSFDLSEAKRKATETKKEDRFFTIKLDIEPPEEDVSSIESKLFRDVLATATTKLNPGEKNRTSNIDIASRAVSGTVICPGDTFSYNRVVGARTAQRGYKDAKIFAQGEVVDGIGGGICQLSSTIYIATLKAGLQPTERYSHRFAVSYTPLGQDATVAWGSLDYKFVNNSQWPIKLEVSRSGGNLTVTIYGTKEDNLSYSLSSSCNEVIDYQTKTVYLQLGSGKAREKGISALGQTVKEGGKKGYKSTTYITTYNNGEKASTKLVNNSTYKTQDMTVYIGAYLDPQGKPYTDALGNLIDPSVPVVPPIEPPIFPPIEPPIDPPIEFGHETNN